MSNQNVEPLVNFYMMGQSPIYYAQSVRSIGFAEEGERAIGRGSKAPPLAESQPYANEHTTGVRLKPCEYSVVREPVAHASNALRRGEMT